MGDTLLQVLENLLGPHWVSEISRGLPTSSGELFSLLANLGTIFGFSLVGVAVTIKWLMTLLIRGLSRRADQKSLGQEYPVFLSLALRDSSFDRRRITSL